MLNLERREAMGRLLGGAIGVAALELAAMPRMAQAALLTDGVAAIGTNSDLLGWGGSAEVVILLGYHTPGDGSGGLFSPTRPHVAVPPASRRVGDRRRSSRPNSSRRVHKARRPGSPAQPKRKLGRIGVIEPRRTPSRSAPPLRWA